MIPPFLPGLKTKRPGIRRLMQPLVGLAIILISLTPLHGQKRGYLPGYVITLEGDTIRGQVRDRHPGPFTDLYSRIRFIPEGKRRRQKLAPGAILGYRAGMREYVTVPLREESAFFRFRYVLDPGAERVFLRVLRRDGPLTYYHREFIHDDNSYLDYFPLFHLQGKPSMVRVTQGILGLKRKRLMEYFRHCPELVRAIESKELNEPDSVYEFYLERCGAIR
ncbi:hypothetical protein [Robiginitalea biformata]|uniref:hypothetical protein n=1 Tax=Robiginitalea biformata TaxID=252307 RepID=UPI003B59F226